MTEDTCYIPWLVRADNTLDTLQQCGHAQPGALLGTHSTLYQKDPAARSHIAINHLATQCAQQDNLLVVWALVL